MKKIILSSILCGLLLAMCSILSHAIGTSEAEIQKNKEFLERQFGFDDFTSEKIATIFNELGIAEITSVRIDLCEEGDLQYYVGGAWFALITDSLGREYYMRTDGFGSYLRVQKDGPEGEYILRESYVVQISLKWWETLPYWLQWILRYILFGWIWM